MTRALRATWVQAELPVQSPEPALRIDSARPADAFRISGMLRAAAPDCVPMTPREVYARCDQFEVVRHRRRGVVAAASLRPVEARRVVLRGLVVHPSFHGRRLGSLLVERATKRCLQAHLELVCVTRRPQFFARLGFRRLPFRRGSSVDARRAGGRRVAMVCVPTLVPCRQTRHHEG